MASGTRVVCRGVGHEFRGRAGRVEALRDVTFTVAPGEFVCIVGPSGCGKTTLLRLLAGLIEPSRGTIRYENHVVSRAGSNALVFQEHGVFPWMTVRENVAFGLKIKGVPRAERDRRAGSFIDRFGLGRFAESYPTELSVGMRQRVGIARAFATDVPVLLMDEPFGSLDVPTKWVLQEELLRLWREDRKVVVFVTHDIEEAVRLGDRVLVLSGRPATILEEIEITAPRPREPMAVAPESAELVRHIWGILRADVVRDEGEGA